MPEIGWSTEWENGPGGTVADFFSKKINLDLIECASYALGGTDFTHTVFSDAATERVYKKSGRFNITLNFRIYTGQRIGTTILTSPKKWIESLTNATPIYAGNNLNLNNSLSNVSNFLNNFSIKAIKEAFNPKQGVTTSEKNDGRALSDQDIVENAKANTKIGQLLTKNEAEVKAKKTTKTGDADDENHKFKIQLADTKTWSEKRLFLTGAINKNLGASLFELHIYNFIYKKPLNVVIKNWEVTPSKEYNVANDDHFYYDFKITCESDQILSSPTWDNVYFWEDND